MNLRLRFASTPVTSFQQSPAVTLRWATPGDVDRVEVLAQLEEARVPEAPLLLALVGDELWVAVSVATGAVISDPFRPSAAVAVLAVERARQLTFRERPTGWRFPSLLGRRSPRGVHAPGAPLIGQES